MFELKELKQWLEDVRNIIIDTNISIQNAERLNENKYHYDEKTKEHGFFQLHMYQLKFILSIQLCKILSNNTNEKRSYLSLCKHLEKKNYDPDLQSLLNNNSSSTADVVKSKPEILNLTTWIKSEIQKEDILIRKIKLARNNVYAHKVPGSTVPFVNLDEIRKAVDLASKIYNTLTMKFFFTQTYLGILDDWSIDYVMWYMNEVRRVDEENRVNLIKKT